MRALCDGHARRHYIAIAEQPSRISLLEAVTLTLKHQDDHRFGDTCALSGRSSQVSTWSELNLALDLTLDREISLPSSRLDDDRLPDIHYVPPI